MLSGKNKRNGVQYYRLKTNAKVGEVANSQLIILMAACTNTVVRIFPNAVKSGQAVWVSGNKANAQSCTLYNVAGLIASFGNCYAALPASICAATKKLKGLYLLYIKASTTFCRN